MKKVFLVLTAVVAALYAVALVTVPEVPPGRLLWATDKNPARTVQTGLFRMLRRPLALSEANVADWDRLATALAGSEVSPAAEAIRERLPENALAALKRAAAGAELDDAAKATVLAALNALLDRPDLHPDEAFGGVAPPAEVVPLLGRDPGSLMPLEVRHLNRVLIEAALPGAFQPAEPLYPGLQVQVDPGDRAKLIVRCATGTGPDIIDLYTLQEMHSFVEAGILMDLTPYADEMGFGLGDTYPALATALTVAGRQYRFPCNVWANCVVYNRALFERLGVPEPQPGWTWDDFIRAGTAIRDAAGRRGERIMPVANWNNVWIFQDALVGRGGRYFTEDGLASRLAEPEAVEAMQLYHDLMHVHEVLPTPAETAAMSSQGGWGQSGLNWFFEERAAMIFIGRWILVQVRSWPGISDHLGAARLPRFPGRPSQGMADCRGAGINDASPRKMEALKFLQYLASPEYGEVIVFDGDALPPNPDLARTGRDLVNPAVTDPAFHQPFVDAIEAARPLDTSPFIDAGQVKRWTKERVERVENRLETPEEAMRGFADEIDRQIRTNLQRRPDLRQRYREVTGREWTPDWWKPPPPR